MVFFVCPVCKAKNEEKVKYCSHCGTWLLSERFPAQKVNQRAINKYYICSFCDTANEPLRNSCKKCMKPLFSTDYETKEIWVKKRKWPRALITWAIIILIIYGVIASINQGVYLTQDSSVEKSIPVNNQPAKMGPVKKPSEPFGRSRSIPAPIGTEVGAKLTQQNENFEISIVISKVIRGEEAWQLINAANPFNPVPKVDHEYILAEITLKVIKSNNADVQLSMGPNSFTLVSSEGKDYDFIPLIEPNPGINSKLYEGASHQGWVSFQVNKSDSSPLIAVARDNQGRNGIWFKAY